MDFPTSQPTLPERQVVEVSEPRNYWLMSEKPPADQGVYNAQVDNDPMMMAVVDANLDHMFCSRRKGYCYSFNDSPASWACEHDRKLRRCQHVEIDQETQKMVQCSHMMCHDDDLKPPTLPDSAWCGCHEHYAGQPRWSLNLEHAQYMMDPLIATNRELNLDTD